MPTVADRIEKKIVLRAPRSRVWRALSDSHEFGLWFGMRLDGPFVAGARVTGRIHPTVADAEVAAMQERFTGHPVELHVERVEPERHLSFRWHPFAIEKGVDYSREPTTLVSFDLADVAAGVELTVVESGFEGLPVERRARAFEANDGGWALQLKLVERYLARAS